MILILSFDGDKSTNKLIDWLKFYNCNFKRINLDTENSNNLILRISNNQFYFSLKLLNGETIKFCDYDFVYNRGIKFNTEIKNISKKNIPNQIIKENLKIEKKSLNDFFYHYINSKSIGCFENFWHSKLNQLYFAKNYGIDIPNTIVTNTKEDLGRYDKYISKPIQDNISQRYNNKTYVLSAQKITLNKLENKFFPSLFQSEIKKMYEIRTFYLNSKCYSIKIISNSNQVDIKFNYNISTYSPYKLPNYIEKKIDKLMKKLELISGSIDLIKNLDGKYYFLEVNPNGQYDYVSYYGGYDLHKIIADFLVLKTQKNETI